MLAQLHLKQIRKEKLHNPTEELVLWTLIPQLYPILRQASTKLDPDYIFFKGCEEVSVKFKLNI